MTILRFVVVRPFNRRDGFSKIRKDYPLSNQAISSCFSLIFNVIHLAKWECKHKLSSKARFSWSVLAWWNRNRQDAYREIDPQLKPSKERSVYCGELCWISRLPSSPVADFMPGDRMELYLERIEQDLLRSALAINNNNQTRAAQQ